MGDPAESRAIEKSFGEHAYEIGVSSTKSMHGHALGAAGGIEGVATALAVARDTMPPTTNCDFPIPNAASITFQTSHGARRFALPCRTRSDSEATTA